MEIILFIALIIAIFCDVIRIVQYKQTQKSFQKALNELAANKVLRLFLDFLVEKNVSLDGDEVVMTKEFRDYVEEHWREEEEDHEQD